MNYSVVYYAGTDSIHKLQKNTPQYKSKIHHTIEQEI